MPPSDTECDVLSILLNILGEGSLSEEDANLRLLSTNREDIVDAFESLRSKDFIKDEGNDGISLDPDDFNKWAPHMYDCDGWSPRTLRERCPHQWEDRFFGN